MVSLRRYAAFVPFLVVMGCGGADFTGVFGGANDGGGDGAGNSPSDSSAPGVDAAGVDGSVPVSDGSAPAIDAAQPAQDGAAGADANPAPCPQVAGAYTINIVDGAGCGDLNDNAKQCIRQQTCDLTFRSSQSGGAVGAINGNASLQSDGTFAGAALMEGTANRTGCTGVWDNATSTMTVDCGGTGSTQSCVVALTRASKMCN